MIGTDPAITRAQDRLAAHGIYTSVRDLAALRCFMEHHVVCVLDFMTLLKRLQVSLTSTCLPWTPPARGDLARFVNEIVLDEETDAAAGESPASHFEWYVDAMREVGANPGPVLALVDAWRSGVDPRAALRESDLPRAAIEFSLATLDAAEGSVHVVASVFVNGREDVIPRIFAPLVESLRSRGRACPRLLGYLERHVQIDGELHGPLATRLLESVIDGDPLRRSEARTAALDSLASRERLWDAVLARLPQPASELVPAVNSGPVPGP